MRVRIVDVKATLGTGSLVEFIALLKTGESAGDASPVQGIWRDTTPVQGKEYHVELNLHGQSGFEWGRNITSRAIGKEGHDRIVPRANGILLEGTIERVDPDGVAYLRCLDSIVMLDVKGEGAFTGPAAVLAGKVELHDCRY